MVVGLSLGRNNLYQGKERKVMSKMLKLSLAVGVLIGIGSVLTPSGHELAYRAGYAVGMAIIAALTMMAALTAARALRGLVRFARRVTHVIAVVRYAFTTLESAMVEGTAPV